MVEITDIIIYYFRLQGSVRDMRGQPLDAGKMKAVARMTVAPTVQQKFPPF